MITHRISLGVSQDRPCLTEFKAVVNDNNTRMLEIDLDYDIPENAKIFLVIQKPNQKHTVLELENDNPLQVELTSQILNQSGAYQAELKITNEDTQITSSKFKFNVRNELKTELTDDEIDSIESLYKDTIRLQKELEQLIGNTVDIDELRDEIIELKEDSSGIKDDTNKIKADIIGIIQDTTRLKEDVSNIETDMVLTARRVDTLE